MAAFNDCEMVQNYGVLFKLNGGIAQFDNIRMYDNQDIFASGKVPMCTKS